MKPHTKIFDKKRILGQIVAERKELEALGGKAARKFAGDFRSGVLKKYKEGEGPHEIREYARERLRELAPILVAGQMAGYLRGKIRTLAIFRLKARSLRSAGRALDTTDGPFDKAVDSAANKLELTEDQVREVSDKFGPNSVRVSEKWGEGVDSKLREAMDDIVSRNLHVKDGIDVLGSALSAAGVDDANPWLVETLVRTGMNTAYMSGRLAFNEDPAIQEILWGYEYETVEDDRVRPEHALLQGTRLPKEHPFWQKNMPPNGWNCRCTVIEVFNDEVDRTTEVEPPDSFTAEDGTVIEPGADEGWEFNPGDVGKEILAIQDRDEISDVPIASTIVQDTGGLPKPEGLDPELEAERLALLKERNKWRKLANAGDEAARERQMELQAKIDVINEQLAALRKGKPKPEKPPIAVVRPPEPVVQKPEKKSAPGRVDENLSIEERIKNYDVGQKRIDLVLKKSLEIAKEGVDEEKVKELAEKHARLHREYQDVIATAEKLNTPAAWKKVDVALGEWHNARREMERAIGSAADLRAKENRIKEFAHNQLELSNGMDVSNIKIHPSCGPSVKNYGEVGRSWLSTKCATDELVTSTIEQNIDGKKRGFYRQWQKRINLDPSQSDAGTAVHEICHAIEYQVPGVHDACREFLDYRCRGEENQTFNKVMRTTRYEDWEQGRKDEFDKAFPKDSAWYVGKYYNDATEILTMGVELLFNDPVRFMKMDPEYAKFCMGILDGSLRSGTRLAPRIGW